MFLWGGKGASQRKSREASRSGVREGESPQERAGGQGSGRGKGEKGEVKCVGGREGLLEDIVRMLVLNMRG